MGDFQNAYEVTAAERTGKGVTGLPDTPGLSTGDMQARFDSLGNLSIDKFNLLVAAFGDVISNDSRKAPTMKAIVDYVSSLGGGDMMKAIYDTDNSGVVDNAEQLGGKVPDYYRLIGDNAGGHNSVYRGKKLGTSVSADQYTAISNGTFDDMYIGDYWEINGRVWRIAHFDYWYGTGDTECTTHHVVIVPDTCFYYARMNPSINVNGYYNSEMRGGANYLVSGYSNLYTAKQTVDSAFGSSHILSHRELLTDATSGNLASSFKYCDSTVDLMSEVMVFGTPFWATSGFEVGFDKEQFALFKLEHKKMRADFPYWLRGCANPPSCTLMTKEGSVIIGSAVDSHAVRPCFAIKA